MNYFWNEYHEIDKDISEIKNQMLDDFKNGHPLIRESLVDFINSNGKFLRSGFMVLCSGFGSIEKKKLYRIGAAIEMLHMATLIHDDIIDNAKTRRGNPSIHFKYGKRNAVLIGDYLFSRSFMQISDFMKENHIKLLTKVLSSICNSELNQSSQLYRQSTTFREYLRRISGKTAALFFLSFYIAGLEGNCTEESCSTLGKIGYYVGVNFQIVDDILDITGVIKIMGKPVNKDLSEGIFTLPVIFALKNDDGRLSKILKNYPYSERKIRKIIRLIKDYKGIEKSKGIAAKYHLKTQKEIDKLPDIESRKILSDVVKKLLDRDY
jgi:heptaprenyl diphosphate synthase